MLRGALALLRGASCQVLTRTIANPAIRSQLDRMVDFAAARPRVNATNKNKRILIEPRRFGRMNSSGAGRAMKQCFPTIDSRHAALVAGIHVLRIWDVGKTWMAGTSPAMTARVGED